MKSKVSYSTFSIALTAILLVVMFALCVASRVEPGAFYTLLGVFLILVVCALFFGPIYIQADPDYIVLGSLLRSKKIAMKEVESVELFQPTMGALRVFASGGFMGYWGIFREKDIGDYYAFYGKASDCFLVRLTNGKKYLLGCQNPAQMVEYINAQISK